MKKITKVILPGLIDAHVHLRVPGGEHKEDYRSGSAAALAGGFTHILGMPNTQPPLLTLECWQAAQQQAWRASYCAVDLHCGASMATLTELPALAERALSLKVYLDETYGRLAVNGCEELRRIAQCWPKNKPIALHAEGQSIRMAISLARELRRPLHFCHVSRREEIEWIAQAKAEGLPVTCEVTPHHLFLTQADAERLGTLGDMRPRLAETRDVEALWSHITSTIDIIASDHAPHTLAEKSDLTNPPPGVPGLESTLPLMLTAVADGRLILERLQELLYFNPRRIFHLPVQEETWVEASLGESYEFPCHPLMTKCGWTPFAGMRLRGRVLRVMVQGRQVVADGVVIL